ncbi:hypothetical protein D3C71_1199330 [compost metagenome]
MGAASAKAGSRHSTTTHCHSCVILACITASGCLMPACYAMGRSPAQTKKPRVMRGLQARPARAASLFLVLPPLLLVLVALLLFLLLLLLLVTPAFLLLAALVLGILLALLGHGRSPEATAGCRGRGQCCARPG